MNKVKLLSASRRLVVKVSGIASGIRLRDSYSEMGTCEVLFLCHDADRASEVNGLAFSQLLDPIRIQLERTGVKTQTIAHPFSILVSKKAFGEPCTINRSYLWAMVSGRMLRILTGRTYRYNPIRKKLWQEIISSTEAKVIVTIGASVELCMAAHTEDVFLVELLHGYRYEDIPWLYETRNADELPHQILALDEMSRKTFSELSLDENYCVTVANPWHEWTAKSGEINLEPWNSGVKSLEHAKTTGMKTVLVCLQWGYGRGESFEGLFENELFPPQLESAVAESTDEVIWIFRLHPVQLRGRSYKKQRLYLANFTDQYINALSHELQTAPLPLVLRFSDCHLSPGSGSTAEALIFGVPSLFIDYEGPVADRVKIGYEAELLQRTVEMWDGNLQNLFQWINDTEIKEDMLKNKSESVLSVIERRIRIIDTF